MICVEYRIMDLCVSFRIHDNRIGDMLISSLTIISTYRRCIKLHVSDKLNLNNPNEKNDHSKLKSS